MDTITVLGMDPSMSNWGFSRGTLNLKTMQLTVDKIWTVKTEKTSAKKKIRVSSDDLERARALSDALEEACEGVQIAFVEVPHGSQSASGAKSYGMCLGVLGQCRVPLVQMTEQEVKMGTIGKKSATKRESIDWAFKHHSKAGWAMRNGQPQANNEHMADAINTIHAGIKNDQFQGALSIIKYMNKQRA
jgi:Holliday junction resolvasome RuvABC endonuclease subunit